MEALGINLGYLVIQIVGFVLLVLLLQALLYKPLLGMMERRRERIAEGINNARQAEEALASAEADKQAILEEARSEAQRVTQEARQRAEEAAEGLRQEARGEADRILEVARQEASEEQERALSGMRDQIISLSIAAANHLLGANLDESQQRQVVTDFFTSVPAEASSMGDNVTVVTAIPLTDSEKGKFTKALGAEEVNFQIDPGILGGVVLRAGAQELDASYRTQLSEMRATLA